MASNTFPVKILAVTTKQSASEDAAYDELDKIIDDNPLSEIITVAEGAYFPDMTKAVRMTNAIYRINVPGYFYHHVKNPTVSGAKRSGILVSCYPTLIDSYVGLVQKEHLCASYGYSSTGIPGVQRNVQSFDTIFTNRSYNKAADVNVRKRDGTLIKTANGFVAAVVNQRYGEVSKNAYRTTYVVNTGVNNSGSLANNMIPIVPGAGPSNSISGISGVLDTVLVLTGRKRESTGKTGSGSYTTDDGTKHSYKGATLVTLSDVNETAVFEGRGTYVYWWNLDEYNGTPETESNDEYLFIPCAGIRAGCHPITKIRNCRRRFNTTIGAGGVVELDISLWHQCHDAFDDHSDLLWVALKTKAEGLGNPKNATITKNTKRPNCTTDEKFLYLNWSNGHYTYTKGIMDSQQFAYAFYGQSLKPRGGKFFVQRPYKLPPVAGSEWTAAKIYPSDSKAPAGSVGTWGASSDWTRCVTQYFRDLTLFDPTVDDEKSGQSLGAKFDVQKDLGYD